MGRYPECVLFLTREEAIELLQRCLASTDHDGPEFESAMLKLASVIETCRKAHQDVRHAS